MKSIIILLVAVGVAVADVSELANGYLPPALVQNAVLPDFTVTEAPTVDVAATTTVAATTVVEVEQVPLEEMHYEEQKQQEAVQITEQPSVPSVPSIYQQPPAFIYETPILQAQTEAPLAPVAVDDSIALEAPDAPVVPVAPVAPVASFASVGVSEEEPIIEEVAVSEPAPVVDEVIVIEEISKVDEAPVTEEVSIGEGVDGSGASVNVAAEVYSEAVEPATIPIVEEAPLIKEVVEVPVVDVEPEPAHELTEDGYRYRTANRFRHRF